MIKTMYRVTPGEVVALVRWRRRISLRAMARTLHLLPEELRRMEKGEEPMPFSTLGKLHGREQYQKLGTPDTLAIEVGGRKRGLILMGEWAWLLRKRRGLTVPELASALGVSKQTILNREAGRRNARPNITALLRPED